MPNLEVRNYRDFIFDGGQMGKRFTQKSRITSLEL